MDSVIPVLKRLRILGAAAGVIGLLVAVFLFLQNRPAFWASFMFAFNFWSGMALGATTLTFLHHVIRATWSVAILRVLEAANKTLPYIFALWLVLAAGLVMHDIYQWGNPELVAASDLLKKKAYWLNIPGYIGRGIFYFLYWWGLTWWFNKTSLQQDSERDPVKAQRLAQRRTNYAAPLGVVHVVLLTLAFTDWYMSLDPAWYSTIYGALFMIAHCLANVALGIMIVIGLRKYRPFSEIFHIQVTRDIGTVMLGFTMFWTYFTLSQWLIIWSGNLPEEIPFYINRFTGGMSLIGGIIIMGQFFLPFTALLSVRLKRDPKLLVPVACWVLGIRIVDAWWQIVPFFRIGPEALNLMNIAGDLGVWAFVGGWWLFLFAQNLITFAQKDALVVGHDLRLHEGKIAEAAHA